MFIPSLLGDKKDIWHVNSMIQGQESGITEKALSTSESEEIPENSSLRILIKPINMG